MLQSQLPKANATCEVCGRRYHVCHECEKMRSAGQFAWRQVVCSVQCYQKWLERKKEIESEQKHEETNLEKAEFVPEKSGKDATVTENETVTETSVNKPFEKGTAQKSKQTYNFKKHK